MATNQSSSSIKDHDEHAGSEGNVDDDIQSRFLAPMSFMKRSFLMALQAALKLGIPDILAKSEGGKPMSAEELLRQLPTKSKSPSPTSISNLERLLSPLVREGLYSASVDGEKHCPVYGLNAVSKWLVRENPVSFAPFEDMVFHPVPMSIVASLHEVILDETTTAFEKVHGISAYAFDKDPSYPAAIQKGMQSLSKVFSTGTMESLQQSGVLDGVDTLVDVGGSHGHIIAQIVAHNPHIKGINFDLPLVINTAPPINGVQHLAGNFFDSLPSADAMFLKWIVHNHGDEEAIQILKNCFKALPAKKGKVILVEFVYDKDDKGPQATYVECLDVWMLTSLKGARERSKEQYQALLAASGFPHSNFIYTPGSLTIIVGSKE
ncbi:unnamed protein product [Calypogeia fissa]